MNRMNDIFQFRALFQAMAEGVVVYDRTGKVIRWNESALAILDTSAEELMRINSDHGIETFLSEDLTPLSLEMHPAMIALKTGLPQKNRTIGFYKNSGELRWLMLSATPVIEDHRAQSFSLVTFFDITNEKIAREKLIHLQQESIQREEFLATTLNSLPGLVSYLNCNLKYEYVNSTYERWFGVPKSDVIGKPIADILGEEAFQLLKPYFEGVLAGNRQAFTSKIPYKDAGERIVQVEYIPDHTSEGVRGFYAIINDITSQVLAQQKVERQEHKMRRILDALPALIGHWDKNFVNLHANAAYAGYFGQMPKDIIGKHMKEIVGEEIYQQNLPFLKKVLQGEEQTFERDLPWATGGIRHTLANCLPEIVDGEVIGFFVIVTDVTAIKDLLEKEQVARTTAEHATALRDEMVAVVSHDLRNPVSVAFTAAESLLRKDDLNPFQKKNVERIKTVNKLILTMLNDLLDYNKMQAGHFSVSEEYSLNDIDMFLEEIAFLERPLCEEKKIRFHIEIAKDLPKLRMNYFQVQRVILNLLGNSMKFTPDGGDIWLRARKVTNGIEFEVEDSGEGIDPNIIGDIFNRFSQARKTSQLGSGLGLAIAKGIVEAHGGEIHAESSQGRGAIFTFTIPFEPAYSSDETIFQNT